jgi:hypothetical protein
VLPATIDVKSQAGDPGIGGLDVPAILWRLVLKL